jgi:hypothetical protein
MAGWSDERLTRIGRTAGLIAIANCSVALTLYATRLGPRQTGSDAAAYIAGARHLAAGRGYLDYSLLPVTTWPPGFSLALGLGRLLGLDPLDGARYLNALMSGCLVLLVFCLARRHLRQGWLVWAVAVAVAIAPSMLRINSTALTEPAFSVLVIALILVLENVESAEAYAIAPVLVAALIASAAYALRYAGVVLLVVPVLVIIRCAGDFRLRLRRTLVYLATAVIVPLIIGVRNLSIGSGFFGPRFSSVETVRSVERDLSSTIRDWLQAGSVVDPRLGYVLLFGSFTLLVLGGVARSRSSDKTNDIRRASLVTLVSCTSIYLLFLVMSALVTNLDPIDNRLLAPIFAPSLVLVGIAIEHVLTLAPRRVEGALTIAAVAVALLWLSIAAVVSWRKASHPGSFGQDYAIPVWTDSAFVRHARDLPPGSNVYSNAADGLYLTLRREPLYDSPMRTQFRSPDAAHQSLAEFRARVRRSPLTTYLVWYRPNAESYLLSPSEIRRRGFSLTPVFTSKDGTIYAVRST